MNEWITDVISLRHTLTHPLLLLYSDTPDMITQMDHIITIQNMYLLVNVKTCQEHFTFIQILKTETKSGETRTGCRRETDTRRETGNEKLNLSIRFVTELNNKFPKIIALFEFNYLSTNL